MIQDILPLKLNNQYEKKEPTRESRIMFFRNNHVLIKEGERVEFLTHEEVEKLCEQAGIDMPGMVYLFAIDKKDYFWADVPEGDEQIILTSGREYNCQFVRMFEMRAKKPKEAVFAAATAWHLYCWYRDNRYCGRCASQLVHEDSLRMLKCPDCGNQIFPKISPAVIVGVTDGDYILMTKYANREYKRYALIAGFAEIGEAAEDTVRREVLEEVGLHVKNIKYYKSQPWGFDSNFLLGFFCELDDAREIKLDEEELALAEWVHYRDIEDDAEGLSLTREMMTTFRDERRRMSE